MHPGMNMFNPGGKNALTIVLDRTGSMGETITALQKYLPMYIIRRYAMEIQELGLVTFDDHYYGKPLDTGARSIPDIAYDRKVITKYPLTYNLEEYVYWIKTVELGYGSDTPEAIACALAAARSMNPEASIWLVTDAIPHGLSITVDSFSGGCPCGTPMDATGVNVLFGITVNNSDPQACQEYWESVCPGRVVTFTDLAKELQAPVDSRELVMA